MTSPIRRSAALALTAALTVSAGTLTVSAGTAASAVGAVEEGAAPSVVRLPSDDPQAEDTRSDKARFTALKRMITARFTTYAGADPISPNPALALLPPGARVDYQGWIAQAAKLSRSRVQSPAHRQSDALGAVDGLTYSEEERSYERGYNETAASAEVIDGFGTGAGEQAAATILGETNPGSTPSYRKVKPNRENDGTFKKARALGVSNRFMGARTTGYRGDAPGKGQRRLNDLDFYKLNLKAGQVVRIEVSQTSGNLKPSVFVADGDWNLLADSFPQMKKTVRVDMAAAEAGEYYVGVTGWTVIGAPPNGPTTGDYRIKVGAAKGDTDTYAVDLEAGDVLAATTNANGWVNVFGPTGTESHASNQDASFIFPSASPLPGAGGRGLSETVVRESGRYFVQYSGGDGPYTGRLKVYRHGGSGVTQPAKVYLDFDGARINTARWGGAGVSQLSPLGKFLPKWGLDKGQEAELIAAIKDNVTENVEADLAESGLADLVDVEITTSLDGPDLTDQPGVTTIVVGGTIRESGIDTIGIAQSIDPGNYERSETGLVLLDVLSDTGGRYGGASLNKYLKPESDRLAFVAQGVGNVTSHEIGHMLGNWHTDNVNTRSSLMDAGGVGFGRLFGVGADRVGGTGDDRDVDFVQDVFIPGEGFRGIEDTLTRSTFAMSNAD